MEILMFSLVQILWRNAGLNLYKTTLTMNIAVFAAFFVVISIPCLGMAVLFLDEYNIQNIALAFESTGPYFSLLVKVVLTRLSIDTIRKLLKEMTSKFWDLKQFGDEIAAKQMKIHDLFKMFFKIYICTIYTCVALMSIRPLFSDTRKYPLMIYNIVDINNTPYFITMYIVQIFGFFYATGNYLAIDGLYSLYVLNVLCQITMLKHGFATLNISNIKTEEERNIQYKKLKNYIDHHNMILRFVKKLSDLYSVILFFQFLGNTASICMGVYIASIAGISDLATSIRALSVVLTFFLQLTVYCIGGNMVTEALFSISQSIYTSGWEGPYKREFRYATSMIIKESQKPQILLAGKIFEVNLSSLSGVLRLSVSLFTLMNKVNNK